MAKRTTIKDIAAKAGVSIGAVHCALAGKAGVGEETRLRILDIARMMEYRPNSIAASLKRKTVRVAAVLPGPNNENRFYFTYVWAGLHDYLASMQDFNIEVIEVPYYDDVDGQTVELGKLLERDDIDGLLTIGYMDSGCRGMLGRFHLVTDSMQMRALSSFHAEAKREGRRGAAPETKLLPGGAE